MESSSLPSSPPVGQVLPQVQTTQTTPTVTSSGTQQQQPNSVVAIPVVQPLEGVYCYAFVKGSLYADFASLFGLADEEILALSKRYGNATTRIDNGIMIKSSPAELINALAQLGYKVICSTGEGDITWTLQRDA